MAGLERYKIYPAGIKAPFTFSCFVSRGVYPDNGG